MADHGSNKQLTWRVDGGPLENELDQPLPGKDKGQRVKRWAPKARTGCTTCRARRVKCDEQKPICHRCIKVNKAHLCVYPLERNTGALAMRQIQSGTSSASRSADLMAHISQLSAVAQLSSSSSSSWSSSSTSPMAAESDSSSSDAQDHAKSSRAWRTLRALLRIQQTGTSDSILAEYGNLTIPTDLPPQEWDFVEAIEYWNAVVLQNRRGDEELDSGPSQANYKFRPAIGARWSVLAGTVAYHISALCRERGIPIRPDEGGEMAALWVKYRAYVAGQIRQLNGELELAATRKVPKLLKRIQDLMVFTDIPLGVRTWRPHMEAFLRLLHLRGGFDEVTACEEADPVTIFMMILHAVVAETTSPSTQLLDTLDLFTLSEIRDMYRSNFYPTFLCPTHLFVQIRAISMLRAQIAKDSPPAGLVTSVAAEIFANIASFVPAEWTSNEPPHWTFPDFPETFTFLGQLCKTAVYLYAIISLPRYASTCLLDTRGEPDSASNIATYESLRASHRDVLVGMLRSVNDPSHFLHEKQCVNWPLVVAGVAVAGGNVADQEDIAARIHKQGVHPECSACPLALEEKLRAFWASGKTEWDDCFDEPLIGLIA